VHGILHYINNYYGINIIIFFVLLRTPSSQQPVPATKSDSRRPTVHIIIVIVWYNNNIVYRMTVCFRICRVGIIHVIYIIIIIITTADDDDVYYVMYIRRTHTHPYIPAAAKKRSLVSLAFALTLLRFYIILYTKSLWIFFFFVYTSPRTRRQH